ncbi:MAG: hypothetical protein HQL40_03815 [Alphaproteobacteria bacterium]|nr:hypothetical protein [Alphaproteobacteria bacterium]
MKFIETLGRYQGQKGVFQYKRGSEGVTISAIISNNNSLNPNIQLITTAQWQNILKYIENASRNTFGLTVGGGEGLPATALNSLISNVLPTINPSWYSYISAILEHEGSLELYAGPLGPQGQARIELVKDIP